MVNPSEVREVLNVVDEALNAYNPSNVGEYESGVIDGARTSLDMLIGNDRTVGDALQVIDEESPSDGKDYFVGALAGSLAMLKLVRKQDV